jgi:hypothetical protein
MLPVEGSPPADLAIPNHLAEEVAPHEPVKPAVTGFHPPIMQK